MCGFFIFMLVLALQEKTSNTIMKLKAQEEEDEKRIVDLENMVNGKVHFGYYKK